MGKQVQESKAENLALMKKNTTHNTTDNIAKAVLVSALASGQGKTTATAALARKLMREGLRVRIFKIGPDYLDPMILQRACGAEVYALDLWMVGLPECHRLLAQAAQAADVILIEGVKGLHDGDPSSADLAHAFGVPVVLVLDVANLEQTTAAVMPDVQQDGELDVVGVILNRVATTSQVQKTAPALHDVPLLASLPQQQNSLPARHLGLLQPDELAQVDQMLDTLADQIELDMDAWNRIAPITLDAALLASTLTGLAIPPTLAGKKIAIARDAAFAFVYQANLECLRAAGVRLQFFSPLNDEPVPSDADAVYIPGGYPELHAAALSGAQRWQQSLRHAYANDKPILAECGGMMAVADYLIDIDGNSWPMAGLLPGTVTMQDQLLGLGMQSLTMDAANGSGQYELRGHAFHYSSLTTPLPAVGQTIKRRNGEVGEVVYRKGSLTATYFHAYFSSCPAAMAQFFSGEEKA